MKQACGLARRAVLSMALGAGAFAFRPSLAFADDLSPAEFRDLVIAAGARRYPSLPIRPTLAELEVLWGDHHLYLYNAYAAVRRLPPEQREYAVLGFLSRFSPDADAKTAARLAAAESWDSAKCLLRPKMYPMETVKSAPRIVHQPFSADVAVGYAIDLGDKDLYVDQRRIDHWGVPLTQIHATALANLEAMSIAMPTSRHLAIGKGRFVVVDANDGYDAARILLPGMRARVLAALGPRVYAGIPGRDFLTFWVQDLAQEKSIESRMQMFAARMPHALTSQIFAVDKDGVRPV